MMKPYNVSNENIYIHSRLVDYTDLDMYIVYLHLGKNCPKNRYAQILIYLCIFQNYTKLPTFKNEPNIKINSKHIP